MRIIKPSDIHKTNLSFAGCGFLGIYHVGVAVCIKKYAPHLLERKISGASAGSLAATCLLCDMPLGQMTSDFFRVVNKARSHSLGPFSPSFNIQTCLLEGLQKFLPPNAHEMVNGKLHISLTRVYDGKNVIVSQFNSREDLLQALLCACFIPVFSGILPPRFHGVRYMDGAYSDNLPTLDENTVTVSPFCGESDICPRDNSAQLFHVNWANTSIEISKQNMNRFARILFPPRPEVLSNMCQQGFDDALRFLHRNNLISCTRCLSIQSTFIVNKNDEDESECTEEHFDPECHECNSQRKEALPGNLPESVMSIIQTYIEQANKGFLGWLFKRKSVRILKALSWPAFLPADIINATLTNYIIGGDVEKKVFRYRVVSQAHIIEPSNVIVSLDRNSTDYLLDKLIRIIAVTPELTNSVWGMTKFLLETFYTTLRPDEYELEQAELERKENEMNLAMSEFEESMTSKRLHGRRTSIVDVLIEDQMKQKPIENLLSRRDSMRVAKENADNEYQLMAMSGDADAFEQILRQQKSQDAIYYYYYMDDDKKMKVNKIFDLTESEHPIVQATNERELNQQLEYDETDLGSDINSQVGPDTDLEQLTAATIREDRKLLKRISDRGDWMLRGLMIEEINADSPPSPVSPTSSSSSMDSYLKPESEQTNILSEEALQALSSNSPYSYATTTNACIQV